MAPPSQPSGLAAGLLRLGLIPIYGAYVAHDSFVARLAPAAGVAGPAPDGNATFIHWAKRNAFSIPNGSTGTCRKPRAEPEGFAKDHPLRGEDRAG